MGRGAGWQPPPLQTTHYGGDGVGWQVLNVACRNWMWRCAVNRTWSWYSRQAGTFVPISYIFCILVLIYAYIIDCIHGKLVHVCHIMHILHSLYILHIFHLLQILHMSYIAYLAYMSHFPFITCNAYVSYFPCIKKYNAYMS